MLASSCQLQRSRRRQEPYNQALHWTGSERPAPTLRVRPHLNKRPLCSSDSARLSGRPPAWPRKLSREGDRGSRPSNESSAGRAWGAGGRGAACGPYRRG